MDVKKESPPVAMGDVTQPLRPHLVLSEESHMSALQDRREEGDTEGDRWPHPLWSQAVPSVQPLSESQKMCSVSVVTAPSFRVTAWELSGAIQGNCVGLLRGCILRRKSTSCSGFSNHLASYFSILCPQEE